MNTIDSTSSIEATGILSSVQMRSKIISWQYITRFAITPLYALMQRGVRFDFEIKDISSSRRYIVASNHQSQLDSFIMLAAFNQSVFQRLAPFRAMTMNRYFRNDLIEKYLVRMGCFPAKPHSRLSSGLELSRELLESSNTIFICPEGDLTLPGASPARPGVAILAQYPNTYVIPAHIQWVRHGRWLRTFKLAFGAPIDASEMTAQEILDRAYSVQLP